MKRVDIGVGAGLIVVSLWIFWYAERYRQVAVHAYGPELFPQVLAVLMLGLAVALIVNASLGFALPLDERIDVGGFLRVLVAIGLCIGYVFLIHLLGFASATFVFLFALMTLVRQRGVVRRCFASLVTALAVWAIFRYFLVIPLPEGWLL